MSQPNNRTTLLKPLRVLLLEDSENDALLLVHALRGAYELEFDRIASAPEMEAALKKNWDVIISDYSMPGFDGLEALSILRQKNLDVPFIIVSGAIGEEIAVHAMTAGASDYMMKGNLKRLIPAIERELREAESRRTRRRAEAALARLAAIVESTADAIVGMTLDGSVTSWNKGAENIYGYRAEEAMHRSISFLIPPESVGELSQILERVKREERIERLETIRLQKNGTPIDVSLTLSLIKNSAGEIIGVSGIERDITTRKKAEAERDRLIAELQEALSHVKTLSGLLPICASCKKIRDDRGYWQQMEIFIKDRSDADFSHGMCPECMQKLYPEYAAATRGSK